MVLELTESFWTKTWVFLNILWLPTCTRRLCEYLRHRHCLSAGNAPNSNKLLLRRRLGNASSNEVYSILSRSIFSDGNMHSGEFGLESGSSYDVLTSLGFQTCRACFRSTFQSKFRLFSFESTARPIKKCRRVYIAMWNIHSALRMHRIQRQKW